jgi:signal transduction histidine kinase
MRPWVPPYGIPMTEPISTPADPRAARARFGRRLALRLWLLSVGFWWALGIPFSAAWWLLNDLQLRWVLICYAWEVPVIGWGGAVLVPWLIWRRVSSRVAAGDQGAERALARFPRTVAWSIFITGCVGYSLGAIQIAIITRLPALETFKIILQGPVLSSLFAVAGSLFVQSEFQRRAVELALPLHPRPLGRTLREQVATIAIVLVLAVSLPLIMLGLTREQSALERERGALLLQAITEGVRDGTAVPDLSSFGPHTFVRVVDRATGLIRIGPEAGAPIDTLGLDHTGRIMTSTAGWLTSRNGHHQVVAYFPIALPGDPGVVLVAISPLSDYGAPLWRATGLALFVLLCSLAVAVPVARRLAGSVAGPLEEIRDAATRMAEGAQEVGPAARHGLDELVQLGLAFDRMAERVSADEAQLREAYLRLQGAQGDLLQAEKLATVGRLVSGVAHELNNPLQAILGLTEEMLADPAAIDPEVLKTLHQQAHRTRTIVRDLLAAGRSSAAIRERLDPAAVVHDVAVGMRHVLQRTESRLEVSATPGLMVIEGDRAGLEQVLVVLVTNGAESAGAGGVVTLTARPEGDHAFFSVDDTGPGIPPEILPRIFEPFFTTKRDGTIRGTGLGLYVALGLVETLGGNIKACRSPKGGARFEVRVPLVPEPAAIIPAQAPVANVDLAGKRALVVDDEASIRSVIARWLRTHGWTVTEAATGDDALTTLLAAPTGGFDLILTDLRMPGMSGGELLTKLSVLRPDLYQAAVVMTGDTTEPESAAFLARNERPILVKPFNFQELEALLGGAGN